MKINPKRIVLDVDGVLLDCDGGFAQVATHVVQRPLPRLNKSYDLRVRYGLSQDEIGAVWEAMKHHEAGWKGFSPLPGAVQAFHMLASRGYELHLVTNIDESLRVLRQECLQAHGMQPKAMHCNGAHNASKAQIVSEIAPFAMVEDRLTNLYQADFVPERVFVDHDDEQDGLVVDDSIIQVRSLLQWVHSLDFSQRHRQWAELRDQGQAENVVQFRTRR